jgi:hypothetical protein
MMDETLYFGGRPVGLGTADPSPSHISPLLTFPAGGAMIGGLIGYAVKRDARGAAVGAVAGAIAPFALTAVLYASGWSP